MILAVLWSLEGNLHLGVCLQMDSGTAKIGFPESQKEYPRKKTSFLAFSLTGGSKYIQGETCPVLAGMKGIVHLRSS